MKKKQSVLVLLTLIMLATAACSQPKDNTTSDKEGITENVPASGESEEMEVKKTEYGTEEVTLEGKKLEQLTVTGTDNPYYCNLEENLKEEKDV